VIFVNYEKGIEMRKEGSLGFRISGLDEGE
jgi:hypothetical protein